MKRYTRFFVAAFALICALLVGNIRVSADSSTTGAVPSAIRQTAYNAFEITFVGGEAKLEAKDIKPEDIYWELRGAGVPFSSVRSVECDGATATITMYAGFTPGKQYKIDIYGATLAFTATNNGPRAVERVEVSAAEAEVGKDTELTAKMYTAQGVDITDAVKAYADISWSLQVVGGDDNCVDTDNFKVNFDELGQHAEVQAVFSYYDEELEDDVIRVSETAAITSIPAEIIVVIDTAYSIEATNDVTYNRIKKNTWFAIGDDAYLCGRLTYSDKDKTQKGFDGIGEETETQAYAYSCNENVCMVTADLENCGFELTGINPGSTAIIVAHRDEDGMEVVDAVCPLTVKDTRVPAKITECSANKTHLNVNDTVGDVVRITVKVVDQYNEPYAAAPVSIEQNVGTADTSKGYPTIGSFRTVSGQNAGTYVWDIYAVDVDEDTLNGEKSVKIDISVAGTSLMKTATIRMKDLDADTAPDGYKLAPSNYTLTNEVTFDGPGSDADYISNISVIAVKGQYSLGDRVFNLVESMPKTTVSYGGLTLSNTYFDEEGFRIGTEYPQVTAGAIALCVTAQYDKVNLIDGISSCVNTDKRFDSMVGIFSSYESFFTGDSLYRDLAFKTYFGTGGDLIHSGTLQLNLAAVRFTENGLTYLGGTTKMDSCKITVKGFDPRVSIIKVKITQLKRTSSYVTDCDNVNMGWSTSARDLVRDCFDIYVSDFNSGVYINGFYLTNVRYIKNNSAAGRTTVYLSDIDGYLRAWCGSTEKTFIEQISIKKFIRNEEY